MMLVVLLIAAGDVEWQDATTAEAAHRHRRRARDAGARAPRVPTNAIIFDVSQPAAPGVYYSTTRLRVYHGSGTVVVGTSELNVYTMYNMLGQPMLSVVVLLSTPLPSYARHSLRRLCLVAKHFPPALGVWEVGTASYQERMPLEDPGHMNVAEVERGQGAS